MGEPFLLKKKGFPHTPFQRKQSAPAHAQGLVLFWEGLSFCTAAVVAAAQRGMLDVGDGLINGFLRGIIFSVEFV